MESCRKTITGGDVYRAFRLYAGAQDPPEREACESEPGPGRLRECLLGNGGIWYYLKAATGTVIIKKLCIFRSMPE